jgi:60 kDa SS-A/Ro ribonucleoprotein
LALNDKRVWDALLHAGDGMPMTAMIRNLGTMSKIGLLTQGSDAARFVRSRLEDADVLKGARVHPMDLIKAKLTYQNGRGVKSDATWTPVTSVVDGLETAFYLSFGFVQPTGKRICMALDVSGSMTFGESRGYGVLGQYYGSHYGAEGLAGIPGFSPRIAASVLSMVNIRVEKDCEVYGFTTKFTDLKISAHDSLDAVMDKTQVASFGGTDCAVPFTHALKSGHNFDAFCVYTDNETGGQNPSKVLREYRQKTGIYDAKLVVNGMTANQFSIADPSDKYMLDVVGFDSSAPQVMSAFIRGDI